MGTTITDSVYEQIRSQIAVHAPERGGALYGPRGVKFVTHFEFDAEGATSAVSYIPSNRLISSVPRVERETGLQFKGIVHSHPAGITRPSLGDEQTVSSFFRMNPHFAAIELPIVQHVVDPGNFMQWYRAERRGDSAAPWLPRQVGVEIFDEEFYVLPLHGHVRKIIQRLETGGISLEIDDRLQTLQFRNAALVGLVACSADGRELMFYASVDYPIVAPLVLFRATGETLQLTFPWQGIADDVDDGLRTITDRLVEAWTSVVGGEPAIAPDPLTPQSRIEEANGESHAH